MADESDAVSSPVDSLFASNRFLLSNTTLVSLTPKHIPHNIPERQTELASLRNRVRGALNFGAIGCTLLHGPPGAGKTLIARTVLREVQEAAEAHGVKNVYPIYVDLGEATTVPRVWSHIVQHVAANTGRSYNTVKLGISGDEYAMRLKAMLRGSNTQFVLVLDELDKHHDHDGLFRWFTRFSSDNVFFCTIVVSNDPLFHTKLRPEIQSSLGKPVPVEFRPYNQPALVRILQERLKEVCRPGAVSDEAIQYIAQREARSNGDARNALDQLKRAVEVAERDAACLQVEERHAREAETVEDFSFMEGYVVAMPINKKLALASITYLSTKVKGDARWVTTMEAYKQYVAYVEQTRLLDPITLRAFRMLLDALCRGESILATKISNYGRRGGADRLYKVTESLPENFLVNVFSADTYASNMFRGV